jgi:hypothetical protein
MLVFLLKVLLGWLDFCLWIAVITYIIDVIRNRNNGSRIGNWIGWLVMLGVAIAILIYFAN